jgi:hypothetical protein
MCVIPFGNKVPVPPPSPPTNNPPVRSFPFPLFLKLTANFGQSLDIAPSFQMSSGILYSRPTVEGICHNVNSKRRVQSTGN